MSGVPRKELTLFDSTCLIVGIIIGAGIYETAPMVAGAASSMAGLVGLWCLGGVISLAGAMCYAELATLFPHEGGDYVYLGRAYGRWSGFLFGWMQLLVVRPGDIASMSFVFANYGVLVLGLGSKTQELTLACLAVGVLTAINILGVQQGKWTQNLLTVLKSVGLLVILGIACFAPESTDVVASGEGGSTPFMLAVILMLFTYGGWNEMAYVAAEIRNPERNIARALLLGTGVVTLLYVLVNIAFAMVLGLDGMSQSKAVAVDTVKAVLPENGERLIALLVCVSAFGALNGLVFTGARISYAVGTDHRLFQKLGVWSPSRGTPVRALLVQGALAIALIIALGSFAETVLYTTAAVYSFYMATSIAVVIFRWRNPERAMERPYRVLGFPLTPVVFAIVCGFLIHSAFSYDLKGSLISFAILGAGIVAYLLSGRPLQEGDVSE